MLEIVRVTVYSAVLMGRTSVGVPVELAVALQHQTQAAGLALYCSLHSAYLAALEPVGESREDQLTRYRRAYGRHQR